MRIYDLPVCPACGSRDSRVFDLGGGNPLKRCAACDAVSALRYADPEDVYTDGYMFGETDFGLDVRHPEFQEYLAHVAQRRFELIEAVTGGPGSILDVGSGTGEVLVAARDRGWRIQGVEPERTGAEMALERGLPVEVAMLEESGIPERSFDVVSVFHVLEHIPDSRPFLRTLARWAKPGGYVVVEVPNFTSVQRRRFRGTWSGLRALEHIVHFTPSTLDRTLRESGLEPRLIRTPSYVGPPQTLHFAVRDLGRGGRAERLLAPLAPKRRRNGGDARVPSRAGWALLRAVDTLYDRAGVGTVVFAAARVPGP